MDFSWNRLADRKFQFTDHSLVAIVRSKKDKEAMEFFKLLSLCHTVMVEHTDGESVREGERVGDGVYVCVSVMSPSMNHWKVLFYR